MQNPFEDVPSEPLKIWNVQVFELRMHSINTIEMIVMHKYRLKCACAARSKRPEPLRLVDIKLVTHMATVDPPSSDSGRDSSPKLSLKLVTAVVWDSEAIG